MEAGAVIWLTGRSGAGKTTVALQLCPALRSLGYSVVHLDGDAIRTALGGSLGYSADDRLQNAYRMSGLARLLHDQGLTVVCSTMSLFPEIWSWNKEHIKNYFEVYLQVDQSVGIRRDPKGLYEKTSRGEEKNLMGFDLPLNEPTSPDLVIDNNETSEQKVLATTSLIMKSFCARYPRQADASK